MHKPWIPSLNKSGKAYAEVVILALRDEDSKIRNAKASLATL